VTFAKQVAIEFKVYTKWIVGNKADIRKSGGIRALIRVLESPDPDVKKNAGLALSNLFEDCKH
jgi:ribosomal protein L5